MKLLTSLLPISIIAELDDLDSTGLLQGVVQAHSTKLLHTRASSDMSSSRLDAEMLLDRIPLYNYHLQAKHPANETQTWMVGFAEGADNANLHDFCRALDSTIAQCIFEGHPDQGGAPMVMLNCSASSLATMMQETGFISALKYVEPDVVMNTVDLLQSIPRNYSTEDMPSNLNAFGMDNMDDKSMEALQMGGAGVHVYVLDTGVDDQHPEFQGRVVPTLEVSSSEIRPCKDSSTQCAVDRNGHGTFCAAIIGGSKFGVAKNVTIHSVKVLQDHGAGQLSWLVEALDWIVAFGQRPAVISVGIAAVGSMHGVDAQINAAAAAGIPVVVAAGSANSDACQYSPAHASGAITVTVTEYDGQLSNANFGPCIDTSAPGNGVLSALPNLKVAVESGTSYAAARVAGDEALRLAVTRSQNTTSPFNITPNITTSTISVSTTLVPVADATGVNGSSTTVAPDQSSTPAPSLPNATTTGMSETTTVAPRNTTVIGDTTVATNQSSTAIPGVIMTMSPVNVTPNSTTSTISMSTTLVPSADTTVVIGSTTIAAFDPTTGRSETTVPQSSTTVIGNTTTAESGQSSTPQQRITNQTGNWTSGITTVPPSMKSVTTRFATGSPRVTITTTSRPPPSPAPADTLAPSVTGNVTGSGFDLQINIRYRRK